MKKSIILGAIVYVLLTAAGLAQTEWQEKGRIKVPSAFVVGHTTLPAGTYLVSENTATHQLMFTNVKSSSRVYANHHDVDISKDARAYVEKIKAVFVPDGSGRQVLHQIWLPGDKHANDLNHEKGIPEPH